MATTMPPPDAAPADADADLTVSDDAPALAFLPPQLLQGGEIIILNIKPSIWFILLDSLGSLLVLALGTAVCKALIDWRVLALSKRDLTLAVAGLVAVRLFWQYLEWLSRVYILTDRRVIRVKGVLRVLVFETPLKNVQHTSLVFSIRERFFALGSIAFATSGTHSYEAAWTMISRPLEVHRKVVEAMNRYG